MGHEIERRKTRNKQRRQKGPETKHEQKYKNYFTVPDLKSSHAEVHAIFLQAQVKQHEPH